MKELAFPDVKAFGDIFIEASNHDTATPCPMLESWDTSDGRAQLSSYCAVRRPDGWQSLSVKPSREVIDYIDQNMLKIGRDSISFEVVVRDNGTALLIASHNVIIGSRWLALVDASTLPALAEEKEN